MSKKTCETIVYISPSDSYDELCGRPMVTEYCGHPICKQHLATVIQSEKEMIRLHQQALRDEAGELRESKQKLKKLQAILKKS